MKSSVLAIVMLIMVLSFGINAFSAVSVQAVNSRLKQLIPAGQSDLFAIGTTDSGKACEISVGPDAKGAVNVIVSARSMLGTQHFSFDVTRNRTVTDASENRTQLTINAVNEQGREILSIGLDDHNGAKVLRSVEITQEVSGFFGTRFKSLVNCSL
jgi:hypothetical protein